MKRSILLLSIILLIISNALPIYSLEVLYNMDDTSGDAEPAIAGHDINNYLSRIDITNTYVYIENNTIIFETSFSDNPITPEEAVTIAKNKYYEYGFGYEITLLIGGVLSNITIGPLYGIVKKEGAEPYSYLAAVVNILRGGEWFLIDYETNITISANKMIIEVPLTVFQGLEVRLPDSSQQKLYFEIYMISPIDLAIIRDEVAFIGGTTGENQDTGQPPPSEPTYPGDGEAPSEEYEEGVPLTWIVAGSILAVAVIIAVLLKLKIITV